MNSITVQLVESDGRVNQAASREAFEKALSIRVAELETETEVIAEHVHALFDQYHGKSIPMPTLGSLVANAMNATTDNFAILSERALEFVRANSQTTGSKKEGNLVEHPESTFVIGKGKGGGAFRRSDRPEKDETK